MTNGATARVTRDRIRQHELLRWGSEHRRDLPWRRTRDPWKIHVAEVMLQQTQVERVIPRWESFVTMYPNPASCAAVPVADIIARWVGLGFNRRAVLLHRASQVLSENYGGRYPNDLAGLESLPGVGSYTARAILCFAFECDVGVLDTNVGRVLARWSNSRWSPRQAQTRADELVPVGEGWAWNQSLLDFGALICTRRQPGCGRCPVAHCCAWKQNGCAAPDPADGSAATSKPQKRFEGSNRQGRGRLVAALVDGPIDIADVPGTMGWPDDPPRALRVLAQLCADALVEIVSIGSSDGSPDRTVAQLPIADEPSDRLVGEDGNPDWTTLDTTL